VIIPIKALMRIAASPLMISCKYHHWYGFLDRSPSNFSPATAEIINPSFQIQVFSSPEKTVIAYGSQNS